jgi:hypothetical protein
MKWNGDVGGAKAQQLRFVKVGNTKKKKINIIQNLLG